MSGVLIASEKRRRPGLIQETALSCKEQSGSVVFATDAPRCWQQPSETCGRSPQNPLHADREIGIYIALVNGTTVTLAPFSQTLYIDCSSASLDGPARASRQTKIYRRAAPYQYFMEVVRSIQDRRWTG